MDENAEYRALLEKKSAKILIVLFKWYKVTQLLIKLARKMYNLVVVVRVSIRFVLYSPAKLSVRCSTSAVCYHTLVSPPLPVSV